MGRKGQSDSVDRDAAFGAALRVAVRGAELDPPLQPELRFSFSHVCALDVHA